MLLLLKVFSDNAFVGCVSQRVDDLKVSMRMSEVCVFNILQFVSVHLLNLSVAVRGAETRNRSGSLHRQKPVNAHFSLEGSRTMVSVMDYGFDVVQ